MRPSAPSAARRAEPTASPTWGPWRASFGRTRAGAAGALLAFAGVMAAGGGVTRFLAAAMAADVAIMSLPWQVPRDRRSARSVVLENLAYQVMPWSALAAVLVARPSWLARGGSWWWYPVALAAGVALVAAGGMSVSMLRGGDLAFLLGPRRRAHAAVHAAGALTAPPGEEVVFRGVVFFFSGAGAVVACVLAAVAFVARHHLPPHASPMAGRRELGLRAAAALLLLGLTAVSRSIYPAIAAHLVTNAPQALLEIQRARIGAGS